MNHWNDLSITSLNFVSKGVQLMVILYDILIQLTVSIIIFQRNQVDPGNGVQSFPPLIIFSSSSLSSSSFPSFSVGLQSPSAAVCRLTAGQDSLRDGVHPTGLL